MKRTSSFSRPHAAPNHSTPHPRLTREAGTPQSEISDMSSEPAYIVVAVAGRISRNRWLYEPETITTPLPANVTEITVRRPEGVVTLHGKEPPSKYLAAAAKQYGGDE